MFVDSQTYAHNFDKMKGNSQKKFDKLQKEKFTTANEIRIKYDG